MWQSCLCVCVCVCVCWHSHQTSSISGNVEMGKPPQNRRARNWRRPVISCGCLYLTPLINLLECSMRLSRLHSWHPKNPQNQSAKDHHLLPIFSSSLSKIKPATELRILNGDRTLVVVNLWRCGDHNQTTIALNLRGTPISERAGGVCRSESRNRENFGGKTQEQVLLTRSRRGTGKAASVMQHAQKQVNRRDPVYRWAVCHRSD